MALVLRSTKGSALTHAEMDANLAGLADGSLLAPSAVLWTPVLRGSLTAGTQTYATQTGRAIKVGPIVYLFFRITMTAKDVATDGVILISRATSDLPYAPLNQLAGLTIGLVGNIDFTAGYSQLAGVATSAGIQLVQVGDNAAVLSLPATGLMATSDIGGCIIYEAG